MLFFSLQQNIQKNRERYLEIIEQIFDSNIFIGGDTVKTFEENISNYLNISHTIGCNSGTDALWMSLKVLGIKPNDIVITTPFSFIASSSEIVAHKGIPLFIDIDEKTFNLCPQKIEHFLITECHQVDEKTIHTKSNLSVVGILPVDLFGQLADYDAIQLIAKKWNLWILEDACQAIGAEKNGAHAGSYGDLATLSFYPTKNLGASGDAGAIVTNNESYKTAILALKNHGRTSHYNYQSLGINSRLDSIQAALLNEKLKHLDAQILARQTHAKQYSDGLENQKNIILPSESFGSHAYHQYSIQLTGDQAESNRDAFIQLLAEKGIGTRVFYPETLDSISFLQVHSVQNRSSPQADKISKTIVSLPIWPELTKNEIDLIICATIESLDILYKTHEPHFLTKQMQT
ncbi:DegT/DnrJ/EryC1/StrS family aminotransferase [Candidatus Babeliales bacterium]|nr:DegT/DnrJ/EryC1/StrS family aminotransferase [Candidatus Babeliales bacterium]